MYLKNTRTNQTVFKNGLNLFKSRKVLVGVILFTLYTVMILGAGYVLKKHDFYGQLLKPVLLKNYRVVVNYVKSFSIDPEKIIIDIKHKDYLKLAYKRQEALKTGRLFYSPEEDWVPANLTHRGKVVRADIRLKGRYEDNWKDEDAWSFKVKVKKGDTLFGMKRFALQGPWVRHFMNEWYWHKLLRYSGLIALRYDFVDVTVNGKHLPIYAIEENFEKRLIENNHLREGPIFKAHLTPLMTYKNGSMLPYLKAIDTYQASKYSQDIEFMKLVQSAESKIEAYRQGDLPFSKVFDVNKMSKLLALSDLVGSNFALSYSRESAMDPRSLVARYNTLAYTNSRFYYNPITSLIEPIAYDSETNLGALSTKLNLIGAGRKFIDPKNADSNWTWPLVVFRDKVLFKNYIESLEEVSDKSFISKFYVEIEKEAQEKLKLLHRSFPYYESNKKEVFYKNQEFIKKQLQPQKSLNSYFDGGCMDEGLLCLDIANIHIFPVEILGISLDGNNVIKPLRETILQAKRIEDIEPIFSAQDTIKESVLKEVKTLANSLLPMVPIVNAKINKTPQSKTFPYLEYEKVKFRIPEELKWTHDLIPRLRVISRVFGARHKTSNEVIPWARHEDMFTQPDNVKEITFMLVEDDKKLIKINQGKWTIDQDIIIPAGYRVLAKQGTHLDLVNGAKILSYSALQFIGSEEQPIVISSTGHSGQGVVVMKAKDSSLIEHVIFDGLSNPRQAGWALTGAVTFYESPVVFSGVKFINTQSEDALNIVRSEFTLKNIVFRNISSDGLDLDFSRGVIKNISFSNCGNDALDASGGEIHIEDIFFNDIRDKGISAGEKNRTFIDRLLPKTLESSLPVKTDLKSLSKMLKFKTPK